MKTKNADLLMQSWVCSQLIKGPVNGFINTFAKEFNLSRPVASRIVKQLVADDRIILSGSPRKPIYSLGTTRSIFHIYPREEVDEDMKWTLDFAPYFDLPPNIRDIVHHGFTEMLNNAHDHSCGNFVTVSIEKNAKELSMMVGDDGIGIFEKIRSELNLPDKRLAMLELSKGKLTTDSANHSGEGIFFTSRMFDVFIIKANGLDYSHDIKLPFDFLMENKLMKTYDRKGTFVFMNISLDSQRTTKEIFNQYTLDPDELSFNKTVVPVRLARLDDKLISRSQAKRLVARFEGFKKVILDFEGVDDIGQAFADEVFRVFQQSHPDVQLVPHDASEDILKMIRRVQSS
ncbi:STAS-like domain-containing protein [Oxalobacter formigenes]|uniref:DUF4325 domain-containing protein n=1 Tax=Oxalobacter formigenes OXCC13 TaxID=556269 RepID=C3X8U3_OXAFO|nr:DUF4325 domain-containing protein [Oxalobacter formigenes]ARQ46328.1 hypothetical protein BRW83_1587 [Oxalobacter formigenes]ARQ78445.1 hypothetical protein BRW84_07350 [Oxalobacter formigenes OXCC13]EEO29619.1 hypothetical protein OFBG_00647 [Oxalobacter formigenes OXCC13]MCZ4062979.1 DUF4325 domain-containing protein [Oxalobacter formigenes]QDX32975.1 DUF4325 domain-containing protein [Oxalobacter formigenes]